ncbi:sensor histidine kinase [Marinicrinis lubricantis]|uniref:histidine kinase n=1 Tax=Marinicrinis lubricantis TaxID=2086470 RepID=A0ABW1IQ55_9BACL
MFEKLYPSDQIKNYLLIDVISIIFLCYMALRSSSSLGLTGSLFLLALFLAAFYFALWHRDWRLLSAALIGFSILAVLGIHTDPNVLFFGFLFADLLSRAQSKWHIGIGMLAIALMYLAVIWLRDGDFSAVSPVYLPIMIIQIMFPMIMYMIHRSKTLQGQLDSAQKKLETYIQQEERHRIARDLHDTLGQTLTMIKIKSELAAKWVDRDPLQAKAELQEILTTSRVALKQVRELVSEMKFIPLADEIERSRELLQSAGIELDTRHIGDPPLLASVEETMLALSIREAVTNIIRHSQARRCQFTFQIEGNEYVVHISDDGVGTVTEQPGNGIQSMRERMQTLHGTLKVTFSPDGGTTVMMRLPLRQQGKELLTS